MLSVTSFSTSREKNKQNPEFQNKDTSATERPTVMRSLPTEYGANSIA